MVSINSSLLQLAPTYGSWVNLIGWIDGHSQGSDRVAVQNECVHDVLCGKDDRNFSHKSHKYMDALLCESWKLQCSVKTPLDGLNQILIHIILIIIENGYYKI